LPYECPSKRAPENVQNDIPDRPQTGSQKDPASRSQTRPKRSPRRHEKDPKEKPTSRIAVAEGGKAAGKLGRPSCLAQWAPFTLRFGSEVVGLS